MELPFTSLNCGFKVEHELFVRFHLLVNLLAYA